MPEPFTETVTYFAELEEDEEDDEGVGSWFSIYFEDDFDESVGDIDVPKEVTPVEGRDKSPKLRVDISFANEMPDVHTKVARQQSQWIAVIELWGSCTESRVEFMIHDPDTDESVGIFGFDGANSWNNHPPEILCTEEKERCYALFEFEYIVDGEPGDRLESTDEKPTCRWTADCDPGPSKPAVGADTVCVGTPGTLQAFDTYTGEERWQLTGLETVLSEPLRPTIDSGTVYVGDGTGQVWALDATMGTEKWRTDIGEGILATPAVGTVEAADGSGPQRLVFVGTVEGTVAALDADDGSVHWQAALKPSEHPLRAPNSVTFDPVFSGGQLYVSGLDSRLTVFDAATGEDRILYDPIPDPEHYGFEWGIAATPGVAGDTVYYNGCLSLRALDAPTGEERWKELPNIRQPILYPPVRVNGTVVAADCQTEAVGYPRWIYGLNAETGEIKWKQRTYPSELSVAGGTVYTTAGEAATALDPETGEVLWRYPTGVGHLTATEEGIYAVGRNDDGTSTLYALDETDMT